MTSAHGSPVAAPHIPVVVEDDMAELLPRHQTLLVHFTADWCAPCVELEPHLDAFAAAHSATLPVFAVDGDASPRLVEQYHIDAFPTLVLFRRGARVWQRAGADERSVSALEGTFLPLLAALEGVAERSDSSPRPAPERPSRRVIVPQAPTAVLQAWIRVPGEPSPRHPVEPGSYDLPAGARFVVDLRADHRVDPPLDLSVLNGFEPHSVDSVNVSGAPVTLADLARYPALSRVDDIALLNGDVDVSAEDAALFPSLVTLSLDLVRAHPTLPDVMVNGTWMLPELAASVPTASTSMGAEGPIIVGGGREVDADEFDSAARVGLALVAFTSTGSEAGRAIAPLLGQLAQAHPETPVLAVNAHGCPALRDEYEVSVAPTVFILRDGRPVWRTQAVGDERWVSTVLSPALATCRRQGDRARTLPPADPRSPRTLDLPEGALPYELALKPPGLDPTVSTMIYFGGRIDVPGGWTVLVTAYDEDEDLFDWTALAAFGPDDIDELRYVQWRDDVVPWPEVHEAVRRLTGLRTLEIFSDALHGKMDHLTPLFGELSGLRVLSVIPNSAPESAAGDPPGDVAAALPDTVINGEWNGLPTQDQRRDS